MNLGNFSSDSIIYLRVEGGNRIQSRGGNGGNVGNNGANGQRALYTRTKFILDNIEFYQSSRVIALYLLVIF